MPADAENKPGLIEETLEHARKLVALLENPEPGLLTWHEAVYRRLCKLADLVERPDSDRSKAAG